MTNRHEADTNMGPNVDFDADAEVQHQLDKADEYFENAEQALQEFTIHRLQAYYIVHPTLAEKAMASLRYANELRVAFPGAAQVFATTAIELCIKQCILQPLVYGLVHARSVAEMVMDLSTKVNGWDRFDSLVPTIIKKYGGVDINAEKRDGANRPIWEEVKAIQKTRNRILHRGETAIATDADDALSLASLLLTNLFPAVLGSLGLHMHDNGRVCDDRHDGRGFRPVQSGALLPDRWRSDSHTPDSEE